LTSNSLVQQRKKIPFLGKLLEATDEAEIDDEHPLGRFFVALSVQKLEILSYF